MEGSSIIVIYNIMEGRTSLLEGIVLFGVSSMERRPNLQGFAQSHIEERRLPPVAYKHKLTSGVQPSSSYKLWVGGVSLRSGIEQNLEG